MARKTTLKTRFGTLSVSISLLLIGESSLAATIGHTNIFSKQYEPLLASIEVSDISASDFSVANADASLYRQLQMEYELPINTRFEPLSDRSGKVILSSAAPLSKPFADVILVLNDNGKLQLVPKTLLPPLVSKSKPSVPQTLAIASLPKLQSPLLDLPSKTKQAPLSFIASSTAFIKDKSAKASRHPNLLNRLNLKNISGKKLSVKKSAPPPLRPAASSQPIEATLLANSQTHVVPKDTVAVQSVVASTPQKQTTVTNQTINSNDQDVLSGFQVLKQAVVTPPLMAHSPATSYAGPEAKPQLSSHSKLQPSSKPSSKPKLLKVSKTPPKPLFESTDTFDTVLFAASQHDDIGHQKTPSADSASLPTPFAAAITASDEQLNAANRSDSEDTVTELVTDSYRLPSVASPEGNLVVKANSTYYAADTDTVDPTVDDDLINYSVNSIGAGVLNHALNQVSLETVLSEDMSAERISTEQPLQAAASDTDDLDAVDLDTDDLNAVDLNAKNSGQLLTASATTVSEVEADDLVAIPAPNAIKVMAELHTPDASISDDVLKVEVTRHIKPIKSFNFADDGTEDNHPLLAKHLNKRIDKQINSNKKFRMGNANIAINLSVDHSTNPQGTLSSRINTADYVDEVLQSNELVASNNTVKSTYSTYNGV